jgi:hypothetical protein
MNADFKTFLAAKAEDRRDAFLGAGRRLGTPEQKIEKDFWVSWTLEALFNGVEAGGPRLLFKGGTSLSKAFGLITRFSEDIDITIFRDDLGEAADVADLAAFSGKPTITGPQATVSPHTLITSGFLITAVTDGSRMRVGPATRPRPRFVAAGKFGVPAAR